MGTKTLMEPIRQILGGSAKEVPAELYPARGRLTAKLAEYERAASDLEEYQARAERAVIAENRALEDGRLSEVQAVEAIQTAQLERNVFKARATLKETTRVKLLKELKTAVDSGYNEFSNLCSDLLSKRREILRDRVIATVRLTGHFEVELDVLLESSEFMEEVRNQEISSGAVTTADSQEQIIGLAKRILAGFEAIVALGRKQI